MDDDKQEDRQESQPAEVAFILPEPKPWNLPADVMEKVQKTIEELPKRKPRRRRRNQEN